MKCAFLKAQMKTNFKFTLSNFCSGLTPYFQKFFEIPHVSIFTWLVCIYCNVITDLSLNLPSLCKKIVMTLTKHHSKSEIGVFVLRVVTFLTVMTYLTKAHNLTERLQGIPCK